MRTASETQSELRAILKSVQNRPRSVLLKLRFMNQQTGDPDEASAEYAFNSGRERETVVTLSDAKDDSPTLAVMRGQGARETL